MKLSVAAAAFLFAIPALAEEPIDPTRIISAATGDWNRDKQTDLVLMVAKSKDSFLIDIYFYLREGDRSQLKLVTRAREKVTGNFDKYDQYGLDASVEARPNGSIAIYSKSDASGRNRWEQTVTVAYREDRFVVAGFTYNFYDTLGIRSHGNCDYNVLTGKLKIDDKDLKPQPAKVIPIADFDQNVLRSICGE